MRIWYTQVRKLIAFILLIGLFAVNMGPFCAAVLDIKLVSIEFFEAEETDIDEEEKSQEQEEKQEHKLLHKDLHNGLACFSAEDLASFTLLLNSIHAREIPTPPPDFS